MEQMLTTIAGTGVTGAICGFLLWERWQDTKARREERERREQLEADIERERIEAIKENTKVMAELSTLIETMVK